MPADSRNWSQAEALAKMNDPATAVAAAVRLVRLSEVRGLCVPRNLPSELAAHLQVIRRAADWVLGFQQDEAGRRLVAPLVIKPDGSVVAPVDWENQELAIFIQSADPNDFPDLILMPRQVLLLREAAETALVAKSLGKGRLEVIADRRGPAVAIVIPVPGAKPDDPPRRKIAARYPWDPAEKLFVGPGANDYPDPPGGGFSLDIEASGALLAMGGIIRGSDETETDQEATTQPDEPSPF